MNDYFVIGKIVNTQGVRGDVRILPQTDDITRFEKLEKVEIFRENDKNSIKVLTIGKVWYHKSFVVIKFKEIENMNDAEKIKDYFIRIDRKDAVPLEEDEYFITDLIGVKVITEDKENLGIIKDVITTGANDVYIIKTSGKDILIPAIKQCILDVDMENRIMTIHLMKGLVD